MPRLPLIAMIEKLRKRNSKAISSFTHTIFAHTYMDKKGEKLTPRKKVTVLFGISMSLFTMIFNYFWDDGTIPAFIFVNTSIIIINIFSGICFFLGKISLNKFTAISAATLSLMCGFEMIASSIFVTSKSVVTIFGDMLFLIVIIMTLSISKVRLLPFLLSLISIALYISCCTIMHDEMLKSLITYVAALFFTSGTLGYLTNRTIRAIQEENNSFKDMQKNIQKTLGMSDEQLKAYIDLSHQDMHEIETNKKLINAIGTAASTAIKKNVAYILEQEKIDYENIEKALPMLTASEIEICRLILQGRKLREMSEILGKTPSNITCQRANIRAKLNLEKTDNLRDALLKIVRND